MNTRVMPSHLMQYDDHRFRPRSMCTSGHRHFFIMSDGTVSTCAAHYYDKRPAMGNIMDQELRSRIMTQRWINSPCKNGHCFAQCDGNYTEQIILTDSGEMLAHMGNKLRAWGLAQRDYCVTQLHLTATCNWRCSYCCADSWMQKLAKQDLKTEQWQDVARFFIETFEIGHSVVMGGEPTVHPGFTEYITTLIGGGWSADVITNFSLPRRIFTACEHLSCEERKRLVIYVSLHPEQPGFNFEKIIEGLIELRDVYATPFACSLVDTEANRAMDETLGLKERSVGVGALWFGMIPEI